MAGVTAALVLSFAWGALAYRELGGVRAAADAPLAETSAFAVAGEEAPPGWVSDFAGAFCAGDAAHIAANVGPPLEGRAAEIEQALGQRSWTCADTRYLGTGANPMGEFYVWITVDEEGLDQWWVFTVADQRVVSIE